MTAKISSRNFSALTRRSRIWSSTKRFIAGDSSRISSLETTAGNGSETNGLASSSISELTAPDRSGEAFEIDAAYVDAHLDELAGNEDLSRYIL